jgi:hypothetical protein
MDEFLLLMTAIGSVATGLFTATLWLVAWRTLGGAKKQLGLLREQAERDGRPYVTAEVVTSIHGAGSWDLVIANSGRSMATDVAFKFVEWSRGGKSDYITDGLLAYLHQTELLVPGARRRVMWRREPDKDGGARVDAAGAPEAMKLTIEYRDELGKQYRSEFAFDVSALGAIAPSPTEGTTRNGSSDDTSKILADINHALRALNGHVGELRR